MSSNNVYMVKYDDKTQQWYGWDEMAEESMNDKDGVRVLSFSAAPYHADTRMELEKAMEDDYTLSAEYGFATDYLPKDGTPVQFED